MGSPMMSRLKKKVAVLPKERKHLYELRLKVQSMHKEKKSSFKCLQINLN
jgi:hypothetical protein